MKDFSVNVSFIPVSIYRAVKARGINAEGFAAGTKEAISGLSTMELALLFACQEYQPISRVLGQHGIQAIKYMDYNDADYQRIITPARELARTAGIQAELESQLAGEAGNDLCIEVVDLGPGNIGIVFAGGSLDALTKDNNVLTLLRDVVQKALLFCTPTQLALSMLGNLFDRFIHVSAFANSTSRPPSAVYI